MTQTISTTGHLKRICSSVVKKCNPSDFEIYLGKLNDETFPYMV